MADEPTGNWILGQGIVNLLLNLNRERGTTLIIVTHDPVVAHRLNAFCICKTACWRKINEHLASIVKLWIACWRTSCVPP